MCYCPVLHRAWRSGPCKSKLGTLDINKNATSLDHGEPSSIPKLAKLPLSMLGIHWVALIASGYFIITAPLLQIGPYSVLQTGWWRLMVARKSTSQLFLGGAAMVMDTPTSWQRQATVCLTSTISPLPNLLHWLHWSCEIGRVAMPMDLIHRKQVTKHSVTTNINLPIEVLTTAQCTIKTNCANYCIFRDVFHC